MARKNSTSPKIKKEVFPKIAAEATIKKVTMADKAGLSFADLEFSPEQYAQLERWRKYNDKIRITLEQIQGHIDTEDGTPLLDSAGKNKSMEETED